jgi:hypothetical protein
MDNKMLYRRLTQHPLIQRLMKNSNWKPAAEAAMAELVEGKKCPVASWRKSSTWTQVELAINEIRAEDSSTSRVEG